MPVCANYNGTGQVVIVNPPPADLNTCALLIPTSGEVVNPFALSAEDGTAIAFAIVLVWSVAVAFRLLNRSLQ